MAKKIMTVQLDDTSEIDETSKGSPREIELTGPEMLEKEMEKLRSENLDEPTGPLIGAEEVTQIATDFLKDLGNKYVMPKRVSKEGERNYGVEVDLKGRVASILIDRNTKEIIEYEITEPRREISSGGEVSSSPFGIIIMVCIIQIILIVLFNFLKSQGIEIPFLTGPPTINV